MMVANIGLDLASLNNIRNLTIDVPSTASELLTQIPATANSITGDNLAYGIFVGLFIILYFALADKSPLQDFGYDDMRALTVTLGLCAIMLTNLMEINFITEFKALAMATILYLITFSIILFYEGKGSPD